MPDNTKVPVNEQGLYDPLNAMHLSSERCFLCGSELRSDSRTDEHVFPEWLLHKFNLWNAKSMLLNRTDITYRTLTIPCCLPCNTRHLSQIENQVAKAVSGGFDAFSALPEHTLFLWLAKIAYGYSMKQGFLRWDRTSSDFSTILDEETLEMFRILHVFLQAIRHPFQFIGTPYSLFRFRMAHPEPNAPEFDWKLGFFRQSILMRMNDIGVVGLLLDNGWARSLVPGHDQFWNQREASYPQLLEVLAKVSYMEGLIHTTPKYMFIGHADLEAPITAIASPRNGYLPEPPQDPWDDRKYAEVLARLWECDVANIYDPDRGVLTELPSEFYDA